MFSEVNSGFFYKSAAEREKLIQAERQFIEERVKKIIELKKKVCDEETAKDGKERNFVVINQKVRFVALEFLTYLEDFDLTVFKSVRESILRLWICWPKLESSAYDVLNEEIWNV